MNHTIDFLLRHGYSVLFVLVFAEQIGLPLPAVPILLAAGALAGAGQMSFAGALVLGAALLLKQRGITRIRPLEGGLNGWRERGFPVAPHQPSM